MAIYDLRSSGSWDAFFGRELFNDNGVKYTDGGVDFGNVSAAFAEDSVTRVVRHMRGAADIAEIFCGRDANKIINRLNKLIRIYEKDLGRYLSQNVLNSLSKVYETDAQEDSRDHHKGGKLFDREESQKLGISHSENLVLGALFKAFIAKG